MELPVMKYERVLERRKMPPRTRRTSSNERCMGPSSSSTASYLDFAIVEGEGLSF